ncbi:MAG: RagB/SusD family nutrient uptake outer membrane protein [Bacteroidota bacterium]
MNYKFKFPIFLSLAFFFWGCDNVIDLEQPGLLTDDRAFESVQDLNDGMLGAFNQLDNSSQIQFNAVFTDEISIGFDNGGQGVQTEYNFIHNPNTTAPGTFWGDFYRAINVATRVIEAGNLVAPEEGEEGIYNNALGQCYAIRAYSHLMLQSYFTTDMADDNALGVIAVDFVAPTNAAPSRNTNAEVFALIEADLVAAAALIPASQSDRTFFTLDALDATRARMAAYRQDYATANSIATQLSSRYPLSSRSEYVDMFADNTNGEVIFKLERAFGDTYDGQGSTGTPAAGGWAGANFAFTGPGVNGSPYFEVGRTLFNLMDENDVRFGVNISPDFILDPSYPNTTQGDFRELDIIPVNKYRGSEGRALMNDLKIFRSSEMLLIAAEAQASTGNLSGAASLIKQLRDARFGSNTPTLSFGSEQEALGTIMDERRIELAFEGHRYVDLRRLGARANRGLDRDPLDCAINSACDLPLTDPRYTFPIPFIELRVNSNIQQNPGY